MRKSNAKKKAIRSAINKKKRIYVRLKKQQKKSNKFYEKKK